MADPRASSLTGKRIVITRAAVRSHALAQELSERHAVPVVLPVVSFAEPEDFAPLDHALVGIAQFDWMILTSAQAVRALSERASSLQRPFLPAGSRLRVACVGPVTADAARSANLPVTYVAVTHNGVALVEEMGSQLGGARVLLPRSDRANPDLPIALKKLGAHVTEVIAYRTLKTAQRHADDLRRVAEGEADAILFFSPSAVQHFAELAGPTKFADLADKLVVTAVGPVTARALREAGVTRIVVAENTAATSVIEALENYFVVAEKAAPAGAKSR